MVFETAIALLGEDLDTFSGTVPHSEAFDRVWSIVEVKASYRALSGGRI